MSGESDDPSIEELREKTSKDNRVATATEEDSVSSRSEDIYEALTAVTDGEKNPSVGTRSEVLAAFLHGLSERDEIEELTQTIQAELDVDPDIDPTNKSAVVELSFRYMLQEAAPEYHEALEDAKQKFAVEKM